jgi:N utilization substance protein B
MVGLSPHQIPKNRPIMAIPQAKFREIVFQLLYSYDTGHANEEDLIPLLMKELSVTKSALRLAGEKVDRIHALAKELDKRISDVSQSYTFARIQSVEKSVLRLGAFELLYDDAIPPKVAIAEAMRLARKFGSPESASFVNAILDNLYKSSIGEPVQPSIIQKRLEELEETERLSQLGNEIREQENQQQQADESPTIS